MVTNSSSGGTSVQSASFVNNSFGTNAELIVAPSGTDYVARKKDSWSDTEWTTSSDMSDIEGIICDNNFVYGINGQYGLIEVLDATDGTKLHLEDNSNITDLSAIGHPHALENETEFGDNQYLYVGLFNQAEDVARFSVETDSSLASYGELTLDWISDLGLNTNDNRVKVELYEGNIYAIEYFNGSEYVVADKTDGSLLDTVSLVNIADPASITVNLGRVYIGSTNDNIEAYDANDGTQLWQISGGGEIVASDNLYLYATHTGNNSVYAYDPTNSGAEVWNYGMSNADECYTDGSYVIATTSDTSNVDMIIGGSNSCIRTDSPTVDGRDVTFNAKIEWIDERTSGIDVYFEYTDRETGDTFTTTTETLTSATQTYSKTVTLDKEEHPYEYFIYANEV